MNRLPAILVVMLVAVVAGCGGSGSSSSSPSTPASSTTPSTSTPSTSAAGTAEVSTKSVPGLGAVLVDSQGRTLYSFAPDKGHKVTCVGSCAAVWPPLMLAGGQTPTAAGGAKASLLGSDPNPAGGRVVTYSGWPLYTYVADTAPGATTGQALNLNGGLWYVLAPSGAVIHKQP